MYKRQIVTIVTERYRTQYALIYTTRMKEAVTDKEILLQAVSYTHLDVYKRQGVNKVPNPTFRNENKGTRYPRSVKYFKTAESEGKTIHANQKPVALLKYLIKTYTKEGDTVLDFASGSMSTACLLYTS